MQRETSAFTAKNIMEETLQDIRTEEYTACWEDRQMESNNKDFSNDFLI
jgi:hypothetical protein